MDNEESRKDEICALSAIYADDWIVEDAKCNCFSISLTSDVDTNKSRTLRIEFKLPRGYPAQEKPIFVISAPWMSREDKASLYSQLNELCEQNQGESVLYILVEQARETLNIILEKDAQNSGCTAIITANGDGDSNPTTTSGGSPDSLLEPNRHSPPPPQPNPDCDNKIKILHGNPLVDRKSTFQAHLAAVHSTQDVQQVLSKLMENRKISAATHNMWAYRITKPDSNVINQNCDDDGETHAGSRLLHLLQIVDAKNVLVVVSRWYGGIQLGPDRFKHINNVARELLVEHHYINTSK